MKYVLLLATLALFSTHSYTQEYMVKDGKTSYDTLTDYRSVPSKDIVSGEEYAFPLEPGFTFFGKEFKNVHMDVSGYAAFDTDPSEYFAFFYAADFALQKDQTKSDWRFGNVTIDGKKAGVVEWKNMAIYDEAFAPNPVEHSINFQVQFFEDGRIRVVFGEMDLGKSKFFDAKKGFVDDDDEVYGPWLGIAKDDDVGYHISYDIDDYEVIASEKASEALTGQPAVGQYFEFVPGAMDDVGEPKRSDLVMYPNPTANNLMLGLVQDANASNVQIMGLNGQVLETLKLERGQSTELDVAAYESGVYLVKLTNNNSSSIHKFIKN